MDSELKAILLTNLKLPESALDAQSSLKDASIDSLAIVELAILLSERIGVQITEDELLDAKTIGGIDALVAERRGAN